MELTKEEQISKIKESAIVLRNILHNTKDVSSLVDLWDLGMELKVVSSSRIVTLRLNEFNKYQTKLDKGV